MRARHSTTALLLAAAFAAAPAAAQEAGSPSVVGLANVSLSGGIAPAYRGTAWLAGAAYEPFVTRHLQLGGGIVYSGSNGPLGNETGNLSVSGRYLFGGNPRSAPFVTAMLSTTGGQNQVAQTGGLLGLGWLHFVSPLTAIVAQFDATRVSGVGNTATAFTVSPSTFAFGTGPAMHRAPQRAGAYDWEASAAASFSPARSYSASGSFQPFLTSYLQIGLGGAASHEAASSGFPVATTRYSATALVRVFYPADWVVRPFVDAFGTDIGGTQTGGYVSGNVGQFGFGQRTHGVSAGLRYYLTPELAIDGSLMRTLTDQSPSGVLPRPTTTFALALTLHQPR